MESFYGGHQGASFVVVKHFDGVDIPQIAGSYVYRVKIYAVNAEGSFLLDSNGQFIERNTHNFNDYAWESQALDGSSVEVITTGGIPSTKTVDRVLAEGMRQCFEQGGDTTDIVNYGEYVIIDTIIGMSNPDNPDNGKVYRRGLNFSYDPATNPLAGAEYIGQIVGPQGKTGTYEIITENEVKELEDVQSRSYTIQNGSLIPGKYIDQSGSDVYNDEVTYSWANIRDKNGTLSKCVFGFTIPYSVQSFIGQSVNPYYHRTNETADFDNVDLIEEIETPEHPFFQQWQVSIPKGKKGDSLDNLEIYPTYVRQGTPYWDNSSLTGPAAGLLDNNYPIINYDKTKNYLVVNINDRAVYCETSAGWRTRVRYKEIVYDRVAEGDSQYIDIGDYNSITGVSLSDNGKLTVTYSYNDPQEIAETIKWLYYEEDNPASGIEFQTDGSIIVHYNTGETQSYNDWLTWITNVSLSQDGDFEVTYNNDKIGGSTTYNTHLTWIGRVEIDALGNIVFYNNDGTIARSYPGYIKSISNVTIDTGEEEGSGSQKLNIEYNTAPGVKVPIGKPINYIIESVVTDAIVISEKGYTCEPFHLMTLYADPVKRATVGTETYWSTVLGKSMSGWHDLGYVRGLPGGLHIIGNVDNVSELTDAPEVMYSNPDYAGWAMTVGGTEIYSYDYVKEEWYSIGSMSDATIDASKIFKISDSEPTGMNNNSIWAVQSTIKYAN